MCVYAQEKVRVDIRRNFFTEKAVKHWNRLPKGVIKSPSLEVFKDMFMWHLGTWISGDLGSAGLMVGLDHLHLLFQPKCNAIPNSRYLNIQAFEGQFHTRLILLEKTVPQLLFLSLILFPVSGLATFQ